MSRRSAARFRRQKISAMQSHICDPDVFVLLTLYLHASLSFQPQAGANRHVCLRSKPLVPRMTRETDKSPYAGGHRQKPQASLLAKLYNSRPLSSSHTFARVSDGQNELGLISPGLACSVLERLDEAVYPLDEGVGEHVVPAVMALMGEYVRRCAALQLAQQHGRSSSQLHGVLRLLLAIEVAYERMSMHACINA